MKTGYWEKEDFEDYIAKGIIALYEDPGKQIKVRDEKGEFDPHSRKGWAPCRMSGKEMRRFKAFGLYVPPEDRITASDHVYPSVDGFPLQASLCLPGIEDVGSLPGYLQNGYMEIAKEIPDDLRFDKKCVVYKTFYILPQLQGGLIRVRFFVGITEDGEIFLPRRKIRKQNILGTVTNVWEEYCGGDEEAKEDHRRIILQTACIFNFYTDRKYHWNVTAKENEAKVMFGVYEEQVKSLFYSREAPITASGRKRPILHWVSSHKRRIKEGFDIDIEKHLRGIESFEMNGTLFTISRPHKPTKVIDSSLSVESVGLR